MVMVMALCQACHKWMNRRLDRRRGAEEKKRMKKAVNNSGRDIFLSLPQKKYPHALEAHSVNEERGRSFSVDDDSSSFSNSDGEWNRKVGKKVRLTGEWESYEVEPTPCILPFLPSLFYACFDQDTMWLSHKYRLVDRLKETRNVFIVWKCRIYLCTCLKVPRYRPDFRLPN